MKKIKTYALMLLTTLLMVGFTGCKSDDEQQIDSWFEVLDSNNNEFPTTLNVAYGGYEYGIKISSNLSWEITSSDPTWVHVTPASGKGVATGTIKVDENTTTATRTATITLKPEQMTEYVITVNQGTSGTVSEGDAYFVTPEGIGEKTGLSWDNAMDAAGLAELLSGEASLDGKPVYLMAGEYAVDAVINVAKGVEIYGGYSVSSNGTDTSVKDGETVLSGGTLNSILLVENQKVRIEGITFANGYSGDDKVGSAITVKGSKETTRLELVDCVLKDNIADDPKWNSCAALSLLGGMTYCNNVQFLNNVGANRGAAISMNDATEGDANDYAIFLNQCTFIGNYLTQTNMWGEIINARRGHFYMNNCTLFGEAPTTKGNACLVNADAGCVVVNSTFIGNSNISYLFRINNKAQSFATTAKVINSLFIKNGADTACDGGDNNDQLTAGWNVFQGTMNFDLLNTDTDATDTDFGTINSSKGYFEWTPTSLTAYATLDNVLNTVKAQSSSPFINEFVEWIGNDFGVDQRGQSRNTNKMQPGAYDSGLQ